MLDVVAIGRAGVDLYALDFNTPLKDVRRFAKYVGGGAANISVGLAKLGLKVALISKVGDDDLGDFVIEYLTREGVDTSCVTKTRLGKTGVVFAETLLGKDSKFIFYRENVADLLITRNDINEGVIKSSKIIVTTGTGLSANPSRDSNYFAMELAKQAGKINLLNLDWRPSLWKPEEAISKEKYYAKAIELADILVGNDNEYKAATGIDSAEEAVSKLQAGEKRRILFLTMGERGSRIYHDNQVLDAKPFRVDSMKTLGAGDGVIAGFLFGYQKGWELYKAARFANAVGALVVTGHSCSEAMPTYDETMMFIEKYGGF